MDMIKHVTNIKTKFTNFAVLSLLIQKNTYPWFKNTCWGKQPIPKKKPI